METKILNYKTRNRITLLFLLFFFAFLGQKTVLIALNISDLLSASTLFSSGIRIVIIGSLLILGHLNKKRNINNTTVIFIIFFLVLFFNILYDININNFVIYYIDSKLTLLYLFANVFFMFLGVIYLKLNDTQVNVAKESVLFSGLLFSLLSVYAYGEYIGEVSRLTIKATGDALISPLILSYGAALIIGIIFFEFFLEKNCIKRKIYLTFILGLSLIPFILGASRGSVIALILPILFFFIFRKGVAGKMKIIASTFLILTVILFLANKYESAILDRFISKNSDGVSLNVDSRTLRWKQAIKQFEEHPFLGDSIVLKGFNNYPHNIAIEVLQICGIIGFIPFVFLLYKGLSAAIFIVKHQYRYTWIVVLFLQSLLQNMFSGSVITATWFWFSLALIISVQTWSVKLNS